MFAWKTTALLLSAGALTARVASQTEYTDVFIIGAGMAGAAAARELHENGIRYIWAEGRDQIGGRMRLSREKFGANPGWYVEEGANWSGGGKGNPLFELMKNEFGMELHLLNYNQYVFLEEYIASGKKAVRQLSKSQIPFRPMDEAYQCVVDLNFAPEDEQPDDSESLRDVFTNRCNWIPGETTGQSLAVDNAVEWYYIDVEYAESPERSSWRSLPEYSYGIDFQDQLYFITNRERGYKELAERYVENIPPPRFHTRVDKVQWDGFQGNHLLSSQDIAQGYRAIIHSTNTVSNVTSKVKAKKVISTVSVGVYDKVRTLFNPEPLEKLAAMNRVYQMGLYYKVFFAFAKKFWSSEEFFIVGRLQRGLCPLWQVLDNPANTRYFHGSKIIFCILTTDVIEELHMAGKTVDDVIEDLVEPLKLKNGGKLPAYTYYYKDWENDEWTFGSYENAQVGYTMADFQEFVAPLAVGGKNVVHIAGSASCSRHFGWVHGAYFNGIQTGRKVVNELLPAKNLDTTSICDTAPPTGFGKRNPYRPGRGNNN